MYSLLRHIVDKEVNDIYIKLVYPKYDVFVGPHYHSRTLCIKSAAA